MEIRKYPEENENKTNKQKMAKVYDWIASHAILFIFSKNCF